MDATTEKGFPVPLETLFASMFELLKQQGAAREIAILVSSVGRGFQSEYDNWNGGTYYWSLTLAVELSLFSRLSEEDRTRSAERLEETATRFFAKFANDRFGKVNIVPRVVVNDQWRDDATEFVAGQGIHNQGRVRSNNIASRECDGLLFRSEPEIHLYRALKAAGVTFAPLPVFIRGGSSYSRIEPDFVILKDGVVMVVEVDGDTYHHESPADAHARLTPLGLEGATIERVRASECVNAEAAKDYAGRLLKILDKRRLLAR